MVIIPTLHACAWGGFVGLVVGCLSYTGSARFWAAVQLAATGAGLSLATCSAAAVANKLWPKRVPFETMLVVFACGGVVGGFSLFLGGGCAVAQLARLALKFFVSM
ncbi:Hypothetical protein UVM_LOCUS97 [uncultured virus]|nr:Hypothetical protein UVM_LOCUS97 [uncultured virus]